MPSNNPKTSKEPKNFKVKDKKISKASKESTSFDALMDHGKDHTWFLINLVMNTEAGRLDKINWDAFTESMGISTKGAAQKRFERLMTSYGMTTAFTPKPSAQPHNPPTSGSSSLSPVTPKKRCGTKRKIQDTEDIGEAETDKYEE